MHDAVVDDEGGPEWLAAVPALVARAAARWDLVPHEPFEGGMAAWTAPATTRSGLDVVVKISFPHREARHEADALTLWAGAGAVELMESDTDDWALLLRRLRPGTCLRDAGLPAVEHPGVGAELLARMATVARPMPAPFTTVASEAATLATIAAERIDRLPSRAPYAVDGGLCRHAVELLRTLPSSASSVGLTHGDLNPGNILRGGDRWWAIDPKPLHGDRAWDPWPLLTQVGDWTVTVAAPAELAERTRLVADLTGLDAARVAAWCVARSVESGLWAADRGWWTGHRGADGDLARAAAWDAAATLLGG